MNPNLVDAEGLKRAIAMGGAVAEAEDQSKLADKAELELLRSTLSKCRPGDLGSLQALLQKKLAARVYDIPCIVDVATAGPAWNVGESNPFAFRFSMIGTRPAANPADHIVIGTHLSLTLPFGALTVNAELLRNNYVYVQTYADGRKAYPIHLSQLLRSAVRKAYNPGGSGASSESHVEICDMGNRFEFPERERPVLLGNENADSGYLAVCTGGATTAPTTSTSLKLLGIQRSIVFSPVGGRG